MKKIIALSVVALILGAVMVSVADEAKAPAAAAAATQVVKGTVVVTKDGDTVKSIQIKTDAGDLVNVVMDDAGKLLVKSAGKMVAATGEMKDKDLVVKSCKMVEEKKVEAAK